MTDAGASKPRGYSRLGRYALWGVVVSIAASTSGVYHVTTYEGGRALAEELNAWAHREVAGRVRVQHIEALSFDRVRVTGVEVTGVDGERVASLDELDLAVDASTLSDDLVVFDEVLLDGLWVSLRSSGDELALVEALQPTSPVEQTREGTNVEIARLGLTRGVVADLPEAHEIRGVEVEGSAASAAVTLDTVVAELYRGDEEIARLSRFRGRVEAAGPSEVSARVEAGQSWAEVEANADRRDEAIVGLGGEVSFDIREETVEALALTDLFSMFGTDLEGTATFEGTTSDARGTLFVSTDGGDVNIELERNEALTVVSARTDGLDLASVVDGPDLAEVAGRVTIAIAASDDTQDPPSPRRVRLTAHDLRYDSATISSASIEALLADDHVTIERVDVPHWSGDTGHLTLTGSIGFDRSADLSLSADLPGLAADANLQRAAPGLRGAVEAELAILVTGGDASTIDVTGRLAARNAAIGNTHVARLAIEGSASGDTRSPSVDLSIEGAGLRGESLLIRNTRLTLVGGPVEYALRGRTRLDGGRSVDIDLAGTRGEANLLVSGSARLSGLLAAPVRIDVQDLSINDDDSIILRELAVQGAGVDALARGTYRSETSSELEVELRSLDISAAAGSTMMRGDVSGILHASGTFDRPEVDVSARLVDAALGPLSAPEVSLTAALSTADRTARVEASGDFEGFGRMRVTASAALARATTPKRRLERADWDVDANFTQIPLTLAMLLSPDLPPWDGAVDAEIHLDGVMPTPKTHVVSTVTGFAALGSDPVDAEIRLDFDAPRGESTVRIRDRHGALATLSAHAEFEPTTLRTPLNRERIIAAASWELAFSLPTRRINRWPRPFARDVAVSAGVEGELSRTSGAPPTGTAHLRLTRYDGGERAEGCRHGGLSTLGVDVDLGPRTRATFGGSTTGRAMVEGELSAETPLGVWLTDGLPDVAPPIALTARAEALDLSTVPVICESVGGTVDVSVDATGLASARPRGRARIRSADLTLGDLDPLAASMDLRVSPGGWSAETGVTSGPHRGRARLTAPLVLDGGMPERPDRFTVESLVYRNAGGVAELSGRGTLGDRNTGSLVLDGPVRRLPLVRDGQPAGRLTAQVHVEGTLGAELRQITARFRETSFALPPRTRDTRSRRERREARAAAHEARRARRERPPTVPSRAPAGSGPRTRIVLDATEPFWVRRSDMRLSLSTRLLVDLGSGEPRLRGRVDVHEGRMEAPVGHYDIGGGFIAFWGGGAEPEMHLRGTFQNRRGERRRVSLFGPLGAPEVRIE